MKNPTADKVYEDIDDPTKTGLASLMTNPTEAPMANAIDDVKEWVLVPKEPTKAMKMAIAAADWQGSSDLNWDDGYKIMIAAAPPSPTPSQHTGWSDEVKRAMDIEFGGFLHAIKRSDETVAGEPIRLWLSAADADGEREVWFDPDDGGTMYVLASEAVTGPKLSVTRHMEEAGRAAAATQNSTFADIFEAMLAASSIAPATGFEMAADRDSIRFAQQFADMYRSGAQGASMDCDAAQALALAIDDILASSISPSVAKESGEP